MKTFFKSKIAWLIIIVSFLLLGTYACLFFDPYRNKNVIWGASFDSDYANYLGTDPKAAFAAVLDEWNFKYIRLPAHWDDIEKVKGVFDFSNVDYFVNEASKRGAKVVLAFGQKTPRWPECHRPAWTLSLNQDQYRAEFQKYIAEVVERYKNNSSIEVWQVENEPFFPFGLCPSFTKAELKTEVTLVKKIDPTRPTLVTDSGELSTWLKTASAADLFGTTMYRVVWNKYTGYFNYDWLPAAFYRIKLWMVGRSLNTAYGTELQAEPWLPGKVFKDVPLSEQYKSMDIVRLKKNIDYAERVGLPRSYLWGAEWWYWLKQQGANDIPDYIKQLPKQPTQR